MPTDPLDAQLTAGERAALAAMDSPRRSRTSWTRSSTSEYFNRAPLRVLRERRGHCLDGGLFAAYALSRLGYPPVVVDLLPEPGIDDDHVLAIFRRNGGSARWRSRTSPACATGTVLPLGARAGDVIL